MPNWCQNQLFFTGDKVAVENAHALFNAMRLDCNRTNEGQKPDFMKEVTDGYFFDVDESKPAEQISYSTRWSPNTGEVVKIAEHFNLDFELTYQECGNGVFGKAIYKDTRLMVFDLDDSDQSEIEFNDDSDCLETLFQEKFHLSY